MQWWHTLIVIAFATAGLAGCVQPDAPSSDDQEPEAAYQAPNNSHPAYGWPVYLPLNGSLAGPFQLPEMKPLPDPIRGVAGVAHVEGTSTGGGIAVFGTLAFIGNRGSGPLQVIDIRDPTQPKVVGQAEGVPVRDADTIAFPDGRLIVISTAGGTKQFATNVTDPANPVKIGEIDTGRSNHNIAVVPGTPITYNSGGDIVDWSDPSKPEQLFDEAGDPASTPQGCHDITFFIDAAANKSRAYCAGYAVTSIWDITDPRAPTTIIDIPYPDAREGLPGAGPEPPSLGRFPGSFSHLAMVNHDGTVLIMGDETGGGARNGCDYYFEVGGQSYSGPSGNLWFYDITEETAPILHGHVSPSAPEALDGSCTAHFGRVIEDRNMLVMGFYAAGVVLVDFDDLDNPRIVERYDPLVDGTSPHVPSSLWDVWYYQGYLFTGDMSRGMDVLTLE